MFSGLDQSQQLFYSWGGGAKVGHDVTVTNDQFYTTILLSSCPYTGFEHSFLCKILTTVKYG